jgi:hypothetical protein
MNFNFLFLVFICSLHAIYSQTDGLSVGKKSGRKIHSSIADIVSKATSKVDKNKNILNKTPTKIDVLKPGF